MARPIKDGVSYFPKDTAFYDDDKVKLLRAQYGAKGMYLLDYLLCECYGKAGYYITWDKVKRALIADSVRCGISPAFVEEFVTGCIRCSFFDERVAMSFGVLTSAGIQRRYVRMFNSRDRIKMRREYFLLDMGDREDLPESVLLKLVLTDKSTENPVKSTENPDKSTDNPQSKEKEKEKVNASLKEERVNREKKPPTAASAAERTVFVAPSVEEVRAYIESRGSGIDAERFVSYYETTGWRIGGNRKMKDWRAAVRLWEKRDEERARERSAKSTKSEKSPKERQGNFDAEEAFRLALARTYGGEGEHGKHI